MTVHRKLTDRPLPNLVDVYREYFAVLGESVTADAVRVMTEKEYEAWVASFACIW